MPGTRSRYPRPLMESLEVLNAVEQRWMGTLEIADYLGVGRRTALCLAARGHLLEPDRHVTVRVEGEMEVLP